MKKTFKMENLDCANCASKMENAIKKLEGVNNAAVNFMSQKLMIEAADGDFNQILSDVIKICAKIEPDCRILH